MKLFLALCLAAAVEAFVPQPALRASSKLAMSKAAPQMSLDLSSLEQVTSTVAGVVAVDGGTIGLDVSFGAFLAVILGLFIPVVFLVTLFIQSEAQVHSTFPPPLTFAEERARLDDVPVRASLWGCHTFWPRPLLRQTTPTQHLTH